MLNIPPSLGEKKVVRVPSYHRRESGILGCSTRRSLGVSGRSKSSTKDIGVSGLELIMLSTSVSKVIKPSSLKVAPECRERITLRTERIRRSQAPPKWLANGVLKCHSISLCRRKSANLVLVPVPYGLAQNSISSHEIASIV